MSHIKQYYSIENGYLLLLMVLKMSRILLIPIMMAIIKLIQFITTFHTHTLTQFVHLLFCRLWIISIILLCQVICCLWRMVFHSVQVILIEFYVYIHNYSAYNLSF